ncbi:uncharacterized protein PgNI_12344 [Pyricularia grisea]|uniref:Zn(2)-C6 fungal-type domain-containing protein n=1 Tax=Pyricularia grisea TaxID=148305 RepID=A0A6P8AMZ2_PYRGI|nr:uncharacterized protein PgNI_12344 [Pyricularia grisea]TLD03389.1 hypothetical protein PgNI_12344 [Pyricularia grisea]
MKFAGNPKAQAGHQVTFSPQTFDTNMQNHSERQSPSSQDIKQHGFSSKSKIALDDWTQAGDLGERRRIENSVVQRNYRRKITERNDLGLHNLNYSPGSDRDPNLISTFRLDKTAALQKIDKKHKLCYRRISVACVLISPPEKQCRKRKIRCIVSLEDSKDCSNCIRLNNVCTFTAKARPVPEHKGKPTFPNTQNIASWIGANVSQTTTELCNLYAPNAYADATTWLPGDTICGQPSVPIADATSPASFPVQTIDQNQPSLLIEPQKPLTTTPCNLTTYPYILSNPQSQTTFWAFQGLYLQEYRSAYGTTTLGLHSNYNYNNLQPQGQLYQKQVPEIINTNTISIANPELSVTQHIQQQNTTPNVQMVNRPKLQCWEHGCNGRSFSSFSNLLRHQRKKSGQATKVTCPNCGTEFTRAAARNLHQENGKCKPQPST